MAKTGETKVQTEATEQPAKPAPTPVPGKLPTPGEQLASMLGGIAFPFVIVLLMAGLWQLLEIRDRHERQLALSMIPKLEVTSYARGEQIYAMACIACHGQNGLGVPRLGKDLVNSPFVRHQNDKDLAAFIIKGRAVDDLQNTTKVAMPPRGGRVDFTDHNIADVVTYVRGLTDPRRVPDGPLPEVEVVLGEIPEAPAPSAPAAAPAAAPVAPAAAPLAAKAPAAVPVAPAAAPLAAKAPAAAPTPAPNTVAMAAVVAKDAAQPAPQSLGAALDAEAIKRGKRTFLSCMACHGKDATGVKNMGKDLVHSTFVAGLSDDDLLAFIKKGRGPTDPGNTTHIAMPPKGGNPALKDEQLKDVIVYLRSLHQQAAQAQ
ncbi:MAG TPA: cytochrome c [Tepidisphaeraceae bacterium]|jgi:disulfide bond formation protein DsbB|nr:cytochrome c [Tepidisphaeraceae bacterium]